MDDVTALTREELVELVAYALWRHLDLRPRKRSLDDARIWARHVVGHLEISRIEWTRKAPPAPHGTH